jgi:5-methyltetrahydropteroyltriglutamate--homocysteine methyltransferase
MLTRTLQDNHYRYPASLCLSLAEVLAEQVAKIDADVIQIDEANITGRPEDAEWAAAGINRVLSAAKTEKAVHLCFGNYGGQTIQTGTWDQLIDFMNRLDADHFVLEMARRTKDELAKLKDLDSRFGIGLGVIDIKSTVVESPSEIAARIDEAHQILGQGMIQYVHPDCGFWMLKRSIADQKLRALVQGRDLYLH